MLNHLLAFVIGYVLDLIIGDPYWLPHPIRLIGTAIAGIEKRWNHGKRSDRSKCILGGCMVFLLLCITILMSFGILVLAYLIHPIFGTLVEAVMTYQILATKCLKVESMKVYKCLIRGADLPDRTMAQEKDTPDGSSAEGTNGAISRKCDTLDGSLACRTGEPEAVSPNLAAARQAVSMIVGRETQHLDEAGVAKAAIETVAENTSDGVIAPMLYLAIGGPVLGFAYKAINTMDSMVGYKNERYLYFGRAAAKLDDVVNFLPARISALFMIGASFLLKTETVNGVKIYSGSRAWKIFKRDRKKHASPNSAQTEAVCAGSLGIQLAGDAVYFGKVHHKPLIGDDLRPVEAKDIPRANRLLYLTSFLCEGVCVCILLYCIIHVSG